MGINNEFEGNVYDFLMQMVKDCDNYEELEKAQAELEELQKELAEFEGEDGEHNESEDQK